MSAQRLAPDGDRVTQLRFGGLVVPSCAIEQGDVVQRQECVGVLLADGFVRQLAIGWSVGTLASAAGLAASYAFDLPTGAAMVCGFGAMLALAGVVHPFRHGDAASMARGAVRVARWALVAILVLSAVLLMVAPRADHPVLDAVEHAAPSVRQLYFTAGEMEIYREADVYAERYRRQADELNERETRSRAEGQPLDDMVVRRISSFIKSYSEMRRGEEFVKREMRGRAREHIRWVVGGVMLLAALAIAPGVLGKLVPFRRSRASGNP